MKGVTFINTYIYNRLRQAYKRAYQADCIMDNAVNENRSLNEKELSLVYDLNYDVMEILDEVSFNKLRLSEK